jgi:ribosomal protein S18 acetylase RimI-like enzyme
MLSFTQLDVDKHSGMCAAAHRETYRLTFGGEIPDEYLEHELSKMRERFVADPASFVMLAAPDGVFAGLAEIETRNWGNGDFGWVNFFWIAPEYRSRGYGSELVRYSAEHFRKLGLTQMFLRVGKINETALRFYLRNGFIRVPNGNSSNELMLTYYLDGTGFDVDDALRFYCAGSTTDYYLSDNSHGENDKRFTLVAISKDGIVVKIAKNGFTTPERVAGWAALAEHYNDLGIYAPHFVHNVNGEYAAILEGYCVYAEEFSKYKPNESVNYEQSAEARLSALGRVAANAAPLVPWSSPYAMYDKFSDDDEYPEIYENGLNITHFISERFSEYTDRCVSLMSGYDRLREMFEPIYRALPKAVFQADMNVSNLLFDGGKFAGMWDFNLSGTDAVLSYAFYESFYYMSEDESETAIRQGAVPVKSAEERILRNLGYVAREYRFTDSEKAAFGMYFNLAVPFWGSNVETYFELIHAHGVEYVPQILDFIEYQMTRRDVDGWLMC